MTLKRTSLLILPLILLVLVYWNSKGIENKEVIWIYASIYKEVISEFDTVLKEKFPSVQVRWYQSGSENVAARVNAELSAGNPQADLIMTSDPFWFVELKKAGHLLSYFSPTAQPLDSHYKDKDGTFLINRIPVGIIAYEKTQVPESEAPKTWDDLTSPRWRNKLSMPSPLESGTALTFVSQLVRKKGWNYFKALKNNNLLSSGGNSSVIQRIETKETPIGIVLLENALQAQKRGAAIAIVYPQEGVIPVPSPIAILAQSRNPDLAQKIYDFFSSDQAQQIFLKANVYSPFLTQLAPDSAKPYTEIEKTEFSWNATILEEFNQTKEDTKKTFTRMILQ
ncbi:MAG: extracellular solute-binding protein [Proteobacteria bacterium]|nr:extracellular solute-binding protein [Pseudomonadota bacterium]